MSTSTIPFPLKKDASTNQYNFTALNSPNTETGVVLLCRQQTLVCRCLHVVPMDLEKSVETSPSVWWVQFPGGGLPRRSLVSLLAELAAPWM